MAEKYQNFKSQTQINAVREENRKARQLILDNAKRQYEINEAKEEKSRQAGKGSWMLDSVSRRIAREEKDVLKAKKKSKKKKKKRQRSSPSDSASEEEKVEWVEAKPATAATAASSSEVIKGPQQLQRETWMEAPLDLLPTTSRDEIRAVIKSRREEERREAEKEQELGRHSRELNPHWRDGGTGLPQEENKSNSTSFLTASTAGDGGLSWLKKAYARCVQQAQDESRSLEEVAAERYGSLEELERMLAQAEQKVTGKSQPDPHAGRDRWTETQADYSRQGRRNKNNERQDRSRSKERRKERGSSDREKRRERSRSDKERRRQRSSSVDREKKKEKDNSAGTESRAETGSRGTSFRHPDSEDDRSERVREPRPGFRRPDSEDDRSERVREPRPGFRRPHSDSVSTEGRSGFMRPSDSDDVLLRSEVIKQEKRHYKSPERSVPRWKKVTGNTDKIDDNKYKDDTGLHNQGDKKPEVDVRNSQMKKRRDRKETRNERKKESSSSSSSDTDGDVSHLDDIKQEVAEKPRLEILSEEQLNDLAAKILRAEIMGDEETAASLKSKLEAARKARDGLGSDQPKRSDFCHRRRPDVVSSAGTGERDRAEDDDNVVVLSRTSKGGMVRPVLHGTRENTAGGPARKKKKSAARTHEASGERTIYFDDDAELDLSSLVQQEKAGTAEDQNAMFSRLAGRCRDQDLDVDDMFVSRAAQRQSEDSAARRDRSAAIFEHRKISKAMDTCNRCFDKIPKHLIIAIGAKSYLCLPSHRSLTDGHCFIVPMQHTSSCTAIDEDVWREMQLFRKSLVEMFMSQGEDLVVMETVMHLKHFPHTALECVPLERETGDLAPVYFKKAIQDAGPEWADNKKLHSLAQKDVRHVIPKGFPYFSVDFGLQGGFATVLEDEKTFPSYFGREIVGGMLDAEPALWRKPHQQSFEDQRQKVLKFEQMWAPYDWTQSLGLA